MQKCFLMKFKDLFQKSGLLVTFQMLISVSTPCLNLRIAFAGSKTKLQNLHFSALWRPKAESAFFAFFAKTSNFISEAITNFHDTKIKFRMKLNNVYKIPESHSSCDRLKARNCFLKMSQKLDLERKWGKLCSMHFSRSNF